MTKIIGLTGGIATGKSTVADMFIEAGIPIIDTDLIAKDVLAVGTDGYNEVLKYFKQDILFSNEEINRKKLGQIVFTNAKKREKLNSIVHPRVKQIVLNEIDIHRKLNTKIVVIDVPLLFESKFDELTDVNIVVFTERDLQVERLIDRDNITLEYAQMKINAQMPLQEKIKKADFVIDNSLSILQTKKEFMKVLEEIEVE